MSLTLYAHPLSSYCQKVLVAFYENGIAFDVRQLFDGDPEIGRDFAALWPIQRMPLLVDDGRVVAESSIIIEHLQRHHPGPVQLIPEESLEVRFMDRVFDNYLQTPQQRIVFDALRPAEHRDPFGVAEARKQLETSYRWLDAHLAGRRWAAGDVFTLADCSAAPALFYADWTHPIAPEFATLKAYRQRLLARPSFARAVDEARPYRHLFPLGAPDRD
ncbi:MAG: glutathione S-transferase family protein [Rhodospirillaceae bacterium]|nr:glutathione S-transferase family protein [Rhodospirillaceae bacterium]